MRVPPGHEPEPRWLLATVIVLAQSTLSQGLGGSKSLGDGELGCCVVIGNHIPLRGLSPLLLVFASSPRKNHGYIGIRGMDSTAGSEAEAYQARKAA